MMIYDLCLAWNDENDIDFAWHLQTACLQRGISLLEITPGNLDSATQALLSDQLACRAFFDRASDTDERFLPVVQWACWHALICINPFSLARRAWDKPAMLSQLIAAGLDTPHAIVLSSFSEQPDPPPVDLTVFGDRFVVKPAHGGGGKGVVIGNSWEQVLAARQTFPHDRYLLQAYLHPADLEGRPAYFRILYCAGQFFPHWWDPQSHIYMPVTGEENQRYGLEALWELPEAISRICRLDLFSTEIALSRDGQFSIVDYVNDPVDLRPQSKTFDGLPDVVLNAIAERVAGLVGDTVLNRVAVYQGSYRLDY